MTIATPHGRSKEDPPEYEERLCNSSAFRTGTGGEGAGFICSLILVGLKAAFSCRVLRAARARSRRARDSRDTRRAVLSSRRAR